MAGRCGSTRRPAALRRRDESDVTDRARLGRTLLRAHEPGPRQRNPRTSQAARPAAHPLLRRRHPRSGAVPGRADPGRLRGGARRSRARQPRAAVFGQRRLRPPAPLDRRADVRRRHGLRRAQHPGHRRLAAGAGPDRQAVPDSRRHGDGRPADLPGRPPGLQRLRAALSRPARRRAGPRRRRRGADGRARVPTAGLFRAGLRQPHRPEPDAGRARGPARPRRTAGHDPGRGRRLPRTALRGRGAADAARARHRPLRLHRVGAHALLRHLLQDPVAGAAHRLGLWPARGDRQAGAAETGL